MTDLASTSMSKPGRLPGPLPVLAVTMALGLLLVSVANVAARNLMAWAEVMYWVGLLIIVLPVAMRLLRAPLSQVERVSLLVLLGLVLYLCEYVSSPLAASTFDEFLHLRTAQDLLTTGTLFSPNSLLPISPYYPGLEIATAAISQMSGLTIMASGTLLLAVARVVLIVALYLFFACVGGSPRLAAVATVLYMFNPRFLYFDAQYAYESLALPLAALALFGIARRDPERRNPRALVVLVLPITATVVVTHHVTSLAVAGMLVVWAGAHWAGRWRASGGRYVAFMAAATVIAIATWALVVAGAVIPYLATPVTGAGHELLSLLIGDGTPRVPFTSIGAGNAPLWEQVVGFAGVIILLVGIVLGLREVSRRVTMSPLALALILAALAYPVTLVARLTELGFTVSARTPEFLFLGVAFVVGLAALRVAGSDRFAASRVASLAVMTGVVFAGGVIVGTPQWDRLPGRYLVSADSRSVEANGIAAAQWTRDELGPGNRLVTDRVNQLLMGTYGRQEVLTSYAYGIDIASLFRGEGFTPNQVDLVQEERIRLVVLDRRLTTSLPLVGFYFQRSELDGPPRRTPLAAASLRKFDMVPGIDRLFDDGAILIYDVSELEPGR